MTSLRSTVVEAVHERVRIVRVDRERAKWWNQRRQADDTVVFCGWYWVLGHEEGGPFGTRSACIRDAFYKVVLQRDPPSALDTSSDKHDEKTRTKNVKPRHTEKRAQSIRRSAPVSTRAKYRVAPHHT